MKQKETIGRRRFLPLMLLMILCLTAILPACSPKPGPEDEDFEIPETDPYTEKLPAPVTAAYEVAAAGASRFGSFSKEMRCPGTPPCSPTVKPSFFPAAKETPWRLP